ncbi:MAG: hypothetical protein WEE64_10910 [Dehalococcoidia bacterium]
MRRLPFIAAIGAAFLLATALAPGSVAQATHPATPRPLLNCADVFPDGSVSVSDIGTVVGKFGQGSPDYSAVAGGYHPLYDLVADGSISVGDIGSTVADFGNNAAGGCPSAVDTQIALASLWVYNDHPGLLTENVSLLSGMGYLRYSFDVPGQGIHYVNLANWDGVFNPTEPEGLVYNDGKLMAQLYVVEGDTTEGGVGWGTEPPPVEMVDIDSICAPATCSWDTPGDGWHLHLDLCTYNIGTVFATNTYTASDAACEALNSASGQGGGYDWDDRLGWMGHLWNQMLNANLNPLDVNANGRFADCFPDAEDWTGFNCPQ